MLFITFLMMLVLAGLALAVGVFSHNSLMGGTSQLKDKQAFYIAEAGWQRARQAIDAGTWSAAASPGNTYTESFGAGEYEVTLVDNGNSTYTITSDGYVPSEASVVARRRVVETALPSQMNLSLTATASASSAQASHPAGDANDNNSSSTYWSAQTQGSGEWLQMNHGSAKTMTQAVILEEGEITGISALQYSSDGSSWTAVSGSCTESGTTWTCDFSSVTAQYLRATFTASASNRRVSVYEFRIFGSGGLGTGTFTTQW